MNQIPEKPLTEEQKNFYIKYGSLIAGLKEHPAYQELEKLDANIIEDMKTEATSVHVSSPALGDRLIYMNGMVEGLRRRRDYLKSILENCRKLNKGE